MSFLHLPDAAHDAVLIAAVVLLAAGYLTERLSRHRAPAAVLHLVIDHDRPGAPFLFHDPSDAYAFAATLRGAGADVEVLDNEPVIEHHQAAEYLAAAQREYPRAERSA